MAASTDIKWFRYTNKGAPQVTNNWGILTPLLDACLVSGFSEQVVTEISVTGKTVELTFDLNPSYLNSQVITVSGSYSEEINGYISHYFVGSSSSVPATKSFYTMVRHFANMYGFELPKGHMYKNTQIYLENV